MLNTWCLLEGPPPCECDADCPYGACIERDGVAMCSNWRVQVMVREVGDDEFMLLNEGDDYVVNYADYTCFDSYVSVSFLAGATPNPEAEIQISYQKDILP